VMVTCVNLIKALAVFLKPVTPVLVTRIEHKLGRELTWEDFAFSLRSEKMGQTEKLVQPLEAGDLDPIFGSAEKDDKEQEDSASEEGLITFDTFQNVSLKVADIIEAEAIPKSKKLLKLQVKLGEEQRQIIAGIAAHYTPETLVGKQVVIVANLKPVKLFGQFSQGMVLAVQNDDGSLMVVTPEGKASSGAPVA
jgi:methionyl-tRNA synthetase